MSAPSARIARVPVVAVLALVVGSCSVASVETPDPAAIPSGPVEPEGATATGPIVELGTGSVIGIGWRYSVFPSDEGWCTQLETAEVTTTGCGEILPTDDHAFGTVSSDGLASGITIVEGIATADTATVWLVAEDGRRSPATLMSLEEAELEGKAFVGFAPSDVVVTHVQAVAFSGQVLETYELP